VGERMERIMMMMMMIVELQSQKVHSIDFSESDAETRNALYEPLFGQTPVRRSHLTTLGAPSNVRNSCLREMHVYKRFACEMHTLRLTP